MQESTKPVHSAMLSIPRSDPLIKTVRAWPLIPGRIRKPLSYHTVHRERMDYLPLNAQSIFCFCFVTKGLLCFSSTFRALYLTPPPKKKKKKPTKTLCFSHNAHNNCSSNRDQRFSNKPGFCVCFGYRTTRVPDCVFSFVFNIHLA